MANYEPQFIKANEKGRPLKRDNNWMDISRFIDGTSVYYGRMTEDGVCRRCVNIRCDGDVLTRRRGRTLFGDGGDAGQVYMSAVLQKLDADDIQFRLVDGGSAGVQLQKYDSGWEDVGDNIGDADDRVDWFWVSINIGGEDRLYFTNGVSDIHYTNGTTISTVSGVKAKYITKIGSQLVIGHPTSVWSPDIILYAKGNSHQFYSDTDSGYSTSTNYFSLDGEVSQVIGFNGLIYGFTPSDGLFEIDLIDKTSRKVSTSGTLAPKSVTDDWDMVAWFNQDGIWGMTAGNSPVLISTKVNKLLQQLAYENIKQVVCGFNVHGQLEVHLGDISFEGIDYPNYTLLYEVEQSRLEDNNIWREDSGKMFPNNMVNWTNEYGFTQTYYGSRYTQSTWLNDYGYEDDTDTPIEIVWESKDFKLVRPNQEAIINDVYIDYEPAGAIDLPLSVYISVDGDDWLLLQTAALESSGNAIGLIHVPTVKDLIGRTVAIKLVSEDDAALSVYGIHISYSYNNTDIKLSNEYSE